MQTLPQDLRYGLRMLRKNPGFTAVALVTLALGIGANTAIFSLIDAVMLESLPVRNPKQLVLLDWASHGWPEGVMTSLSGNMDRDKTGRTTSTSFAFPAYELIRARNQVFSDVLALSGNESQLNVGYNGEAGRADGELVSGTFFSTLAVQPILGRTLNPGDDRIGANPAAVISYGYWERRFGRDPSAVGRTMTVNSVPVTIVGISPSEFYGVQPGRAVEVWLPMHLQPQIEPSWSPSGPQGGAQPVASLFQARDNWWVLIMGRLKPGVSEPVARAQLDAILQQSIAPDVKPTTKSETLPHLELESGSKGLNDLRGEFSAPLFILMSFVGLVLLIACANVANLQLARAASRQKEIAVRLAVGAGRLRVVRMLLTESILLALMGGTVGLVLAFWGTEFLVALMSSGRYPISLTVAPDLRVLGFAAGVSLLTGILFGISPALRGTRVDLTPVLKESTGILGGPGHVRHRRIWGLGNALVVVQVSLSLMLLVGAGLFARTLVNLEHTNAGFDQRNLLLFGIDPTQGGYKGQRLAGFYQELTRGLEALPGVRSVSMSAHTLVGGGVTISDIHMPALVPKPGQKIGEMDAHVNKVGPKFLETMGIPLFVGRTLGEGDSEARPKVAVVNKEFVRQFLGGESPLGRRFGFGSGDHAEPADIEIVGVVGDAKFSDLRREVPPTIYLPALQDLSGLAWMNYEVRTAGDPLAIVPAVRRVAADLDRNLALFQIKSQVEQTNESLFQERLFARLTSLFGLLAGILAGVGVYGVMAFAVTQRTREIGIRMALGATRNEIAGMVFGETLIVVAAAVALGIAAALGASRLIAGLLYGLKPTDPVTVTAAALLILMAALLAGLTPTRRATKVDPMVALRYE